MSNRAKLLVSVLFIAVIFLCIGLTRFYFDVTKNTENVNDNAEIISIVQTYGMMRVFESTNGFYGVLNAEDAVVIEPEWMEILDITPDLVLVSRRMNNTVLIGGIDYEENVVLPFVFRSMVSLGDQYYVGTIEEDGSCLIYDTNYKLVFHQSYDNAVYESGMLDLETGGCIFSYYIPEGKPMLRKAEMTCDIGGVPLKWRVGNQVYLSELNADDLRRINDCVISYVDMLLQDDFTDLPQISAGDYINALTRRGTFAEDMQFESVSDFSFGSAEKEKGVYRFAFTISYHEAEPEHTSKMVQVQFSFRRNANNKMILTSADLNFKSTELPVPEELGADAE